MNLEENYHVITVDHVELKPYLHEYTIQLC